jgi:hypothetical protein
MLMFIGVVGEIREVPIFPPLHRESPVDENLRGLFVSANPVFVAVARVLKRVLRGEVIGIEAI